MASNNRATMIAKVLKILKRHYEPVKTQSERSLLEHLLFACCLENSLHGPSAEVFEALTKDYFDWNEVRVSSIRELTLVMKPLNDPSESAVRLKRVLQSVFETHYTFDLEPMKKQNIGQTVKTIEKYNGSTPFIVSYVTQNALGGHAIPVNGGLLESMRVVGVISDNEFAKGTVPGLERAVPKSKGVETSTLLHQLGVELQRSPYGPKIRKLLLEINPDCKDRLPKRPAKKAPQPAPATAAKSTTTKSAGTAKSTTTAKSSKTAQSAKPPAAASPDKKKPVQKKAPPQKKASPKKQSPPKKKSAPQKTASKSPTKKKSPKKKTKVVKKKAPAKKKTTSKKKTSKRKPK